MDALFELSVSVAPRSSREVSRTLHQALRSAILQGRIKPGTKLPPTRQAQSIFGVSRNTAQEIYERLTEEGLTAARHGSGTYVADPLPIAETPQVCPLTDEPHANLNTFWVRSDVSSALNFWHDIREGDPSREPIVDLRPSLIDPRFFPFATLRQVMARELRRLETRPSSLRSPPWNQGSPDLRSAIAGHIALTRAIACKADDVVVTSGAQQAWDLIARILVQPGKTVVAVEDPGYPPMRVPFNAAGARVLPVRVDEQGLVVSEIPSECQIVCVCPSHQFPLGMSMSAARRSELLEFARRNHAVVLEDDYDGEFRYDGSPLDALRAAASSDVVFYIGTFSKCMIPALRMGFIIPPPWALKALIAAKNSLDWYSSLPLQLAVGSFIREGHLARHILQIRRIYNDRRDHLLSLLRDQLNGVLEPVAPTYGMHLTAFAIRDINAEQVSERLSERRIRCHSLNRYFLGPVDRSGFVLGYASADVDGLTVAVEALTEELSTTGGAGILGERSRYSEP